LLIDSSWVKLRKLEKDHQTQKKFPNEINLALSQVPKKLGDLAKEWAPNSLIVSFKLETDEALLLQKAERAIEKYSVNLVVANLLHSRRNHCVLVSRQNISSPLPAAPRESVTAEIQQQVSQVLLFDYDHIYLNENNELFIENQLTSKIVEKHQLFIKEKYQFYFNQQESTTTGSEDYQNTSNSTAVQEIETLTKKQKNNENLDNVITSFIGKMFEQKHSLVCQQIQYYLTQTNTKQPQELTSVGLLARDTEAHKMIKTDYHFGKNPIPMLGGLCIMLSFIAVKEYFDIVGTPSSQ
jgi:hypothetical protein